MLEWLLLYSEIVVGIKGRKISIDPSFLYVTSQQTRLRYPVGRQNYAPVASSVFLICRRCIKFFFQKFQDVY